MIELDTSTWQGADRREEGETNCSHKQWISTSLIWNYYNSSYWPSDICLNSWLSCYSSILAMKLQLSPILCMTRAYVMYYTPFAICHAAGLFITIARNMTATLCLTLFITQVCDRCRVNISTPTTQHYVTIYGLSKNTSRPWRVPGMQQHSCLKI